MCMTNKIVFRTNTTVFRTNTIVFRINTVQLLTNTVLFRGGREAAVGLTAGEEGLRDLVVSQLSRMMVAAVVLRLADVTLWRVSTSSSTTSKAQAQCFYIWLSLIFGKFR